VKMRNRLIFFTAVMVIISGLAFPYESEAASLLLTFPNGGEQLQAGRTYLITWEGYGQAKVYLSTTSGKNYNTIIGGGTNGFYSWTIPADMPPTQNARIKIESFIHPNIFSYKTIEDSSDSDFSILIPTPKAPTQLNAEAVSSNSIRLAWVDASTNENGFTLERRKQGDPSAVVLKIIDKPNATSYLDEGLVPFTTYYYRVKAYNDTGESGYSSEASATTFLVGLQATILGPPAAPSDLAAEALSHSEIRLTWQDNADDEQGFYLERNGTQIVTLPADTQTYTDTGLTPDTTYGYRVRAYSGLGTSEYSSQASATTDPEPPPSQSEPPPPASGPALTPPGTATVIQLTIDSVEYYVNGQLQTMDTPPVIHEGRTLLPIRYVAEPLGAAVGWESGQRRATVTLGQQSVELWIGENQARINGAYQYIDDKNPGVVPLIMPPGRTMLPLRFIAETLGCQVEWDAATRRVTITYPSV
jgi:hypothetical protein